MSIYSVWLWNMVFHIKRGTKASDIWEQYHTANIWAPIDENGESAKMRNFIVYPVHPISIITPIIANINVHKLNWITIWTACRVIDFKKYIFNIKKVHEIREAQRDRKWDWIAQIQQISRKVTRWWLWWPRNAFNISISNPIEKRLLGRPKSRYEWFINK